MASTITKQIKEVRGILANTKALLFAKSAGRCELCNKSVIKDIVTGEELIWGEMAHIYAFSENGPRSTIDKIEKNNIKNLLLACPNCHEKIDKGVQEKYYTVEFLQRSKKDHESRINLTTSFSPKQKTKVLSMVANVNNESVSLSDYDMHKALMGEKLFMSENKNEEINFTQNSGLNNSLYWKSKKQEIDEVLLKFYSDFKREKMEHVSVFGIGPIPLLMYLGSKLDNKIKTKLFQRHRDGELWAWKKKKEKAAYQFKSVKKGSDSNKVAILLSLSGLIDRKLLPDNFKDHYIYELSLIDNPNYNFLQTEKDLFNFERDFSTAISEIKNTHPSLRQIDVIPAIPAPVGISCGRSLNKNSDPRLRIFNTSNKKKFTYALTINN
jgi:hypothetical protein